MLWNIIHHKFSRKYLLKAKIHLKPCIQFKDIPESIRAISESPSHALKLISLISEVQNSDQSLHDDGAKCDATLCALTPTPSGVLSLQLTTAIILLYMGRGGYLITFIALLCINFAGALNLFRRGLNNLPSLLFLFYWGTRDWIGCRPSVNQGIKNLYRQPKCLGMRAIICILYLDADATDHVRL